MSSLIQECNLCDKEIDHICEFNENPINRLTDEMKKFGIIGKIIQPKPKVDGEEKKIPFWSTRHIYDCSNEFWGQYSTPVFEFEQGGLKHWFGVMELGMVDAICKVPALPAAMDSLSISERIKNNNPGEQYQRPLDFDRIDNIRTFLAEKPTILNPIIIDFSKSSINNESVKISDNPNGFMELKINLQKIDFILENKTDVGKKNPRPDYRPLDLVDGQHRVRSSGINFNALGLKIPFVLINPEYEGGGGRIFSEINVQQEDLKKLFKLYNRYMKSLSSHKELEDFGEVNESFFDKTCEEKKYDKRRYANRIAYKVGARLNLNKNGPLYDAIQYYDNNSNETKNIESKAIGVIKADEWVFRCREWAIQRIELAKDEEKFTKIIEAYFKAWKKTANTDPSTGKFYEDYNTENNRWGYGTKSESKIMNRSRIFNKIFFLPIMDLFPMCYDLAKIDESNTIDEIENAFFKVLYPCQPIDGCDFEAWSYIMSRGKLLDQQNYIYQWMSWAIKDYSLSGKLVEPIKAWDSTDESSAILSRPGQGFFSPINRDYFVGTLKVKNLSNNSDDGLQGSTITVTADAIPNESYPKNISWRFKDYNGIIRDERKKITKGNNGNIGFNFFEQKFFSATTSKVHGFKSLIIEIRSRNLFMDENDEGGVIYEQEYTLEELRNIGESGVILSNQETKMNYENLSFTFDKFELENINEEKPSTHYAIKNDKDLSERAKTIEDVDLEKIDIGLEKKRRENILSSLSSFPPPRNMHSHSETNINNRIKYQPKFFPYCNACFNGIHDPASCGYTNKYLNS